MFSTLLIIIKKCKFPLYLPSPLPLSFSLSPQYVVTTDYPPEPSNDYLDQSFRKGDIMQVLDQHIGGRWFMCANMGGGTFAHG